MPNDKEISLVNTQAAQRPPSVEDDHDVLGEIAAALKSIRFGSIVLTIHEGRLVEITKTVRSRFQQR